MARFNEETGERITQPPPAEKPDPKPAKSESDKPSGSDNPTDSKPAKRGK
jgi:hypothetical protein